MTVAATTLQLGPTLKAQSGGRELVTVDFSKAPLGDPPKEVRVTSGKLEVVEKDGVHMLKSGTDSTFIVMVPEKIPNHFALEFDLVPKTSGWTSGPTELSFEGTREVSHSDDSAHVLWNHHRISVIGGGQAYAGGQVDMPEDVKEEIIGFLTKIRAEFNDGNLTVQTNGRTVFESKTAKFLRGRVVRVQLGGEEGDDGAVYLANMRMVALDGGTMQGKGNAPDQTPASTAATTSSTTGTPPPATQTPASTTVPTAPTSQSTTTTASNTPAPAPQAPPPVYAPSPTPTPVTTTPQTTTTTTATGLPRTGGTILQPEPITTTTTATGTPTTGGTIVQPDGTTAPFSSGPRSVSLMPTTTTTTTNTGTTPTHL